MKIRSARMERGLLILETPDMAEAFRFVSSYKPGEDYSITKTKQKRSLDANAYCWVLLDKLSAALRIPTFEIYRNAIRQIGGVSEVVCVQDDAVRTLCDKWSKKGNGWQAEAFESKLPGCTNVTLYYGSSTYDTEQMSRLIDNLIQDCNALGIEVRPTEEVKSLLEGWNEKSE